MSARKTDGNPSHVHFLPGVGAGRRHKYNIHTVRQCECYTEGGGGDGRGSHCVWWWGDIRLRTPGAEGNEPCRDLEGARHSGDGGRCKSPEAGRAGHVQIAVAKESRHGCVLSPCLFR